MEEGIAALSQIVRASEGTIVVRWRELLVASGGGAGRIKGAELEKQCRDFLSAFVAALSAGPTSVTDPAFAIARGLLGEISRSRAIQGFTPTETAMFVLSLKEPLFEQVRASYADDAARVASVGWEMTQILDQLGLYTMEVYQRSREEVVRRQQDEIAELSTPVVKLWDGILALPLIGTLDSARTQVVMENLLQAIVDHSADLAIIDITGVPTVDTLVAQHLLKTIAAARLMGADCIVSGIRPQIAQTMVHLGVELDVVSKATLADALALAFQRTGRSVVRKATVKG
ncbi:STAS domain-containing protein [uncultured Sphingomonas sp.]|uniref:STAS domain-containing protein n=1 Tax=uncultured Sphingomonas sp. TaxID=158754 RepID=UPI0035CA1397